MEAVFFDLDGTLLDTLPDIRAAVNAVFEKYGFPAVSREQTCAAVGSGARVLMERLLPAGAPLGECLADFREYYAMHSCADTRPFAGVKETLAALKGRVKLAVVTNKPHEATVRVIEKFFGDTFDFVAGDSGDFPVKPDPALTRYAALTLRVAPKNCLFVGDGETDYLTAKHAGMRPLAALWGYRTREQLEAVGAREFVGSIEEVIDFI